MSISTIILNQILVAYGNAPVAAIGIGTGNHISNQHFHTIIYDLCIRNKQADNRLPEKEKQCCLCGSSPFYCNLAVETQENFIGESGQVAFFTGWCYADDSRLAE